MIAALLPGAFVTTTDGGAGSADPVSVIIRAEAGGLELVRSAVEDVGGFVTLDLSIIGGLAASVPEHALGALSVVPGVLSLTEDSSISLNSARDRAAADEIAMAELTTEILNVDAIWQRGVTGDGVGVALIDSGVAPVGGLDADGKIFNGPDLSFDAQYDNLRHLDSYGHGTHLAGIIAGEDPAIALQPSQRSARTNFAGVAPGSHVVNVKVADGLGTADVSQVIAGIQWVVEHKDDPGVNIRVLNLAFGTDGVQDYEVDPLAYAVEKAWDAGIVVVVASGNDGNDAALRNPATDPFVLAVGASDPNGSPGSHDDTVLSFANCGVGERTVDVIAPGRSIASLRVPDSFIDWAFPEAVEGDRYFKGTGTSQAAAVTAGVAALILDAHPGMSPDEVKAQITGTTTPIRGASDGCEDAGAIHPVRAVSRVIPNVAPQDFTSSDGSGSLEAARGSYHVALDGEPIVGEVDILGNSWSGGTWSGGTWSGGTWSGGTWSGGTWSGGTWSGNSWSGNSWSGGTWSGGTWSGGTWSGGTWSGGTWSGNSWSGNSWSGGTWSSGTWSSGTWSSGTWSAGTWSSGTWSTGTWSTSLWE